MLIKQVLTIMSLTKPTKPPPMAGAKPGSFTATGMKSSSDAGSPPYVDLKYLLDIRRRKSSGILKGNTNSGRAPVLCHDHWLGRGIDPGLHPKPRTGDRQLEQFELKISAAQNPN